MGNRKDDIPQTTKEIEQEINRLRKSPFVKYAKMVDITAEVVETLDYGAEKFLKCRVGEEICYVYTEKAVEGVIRLVPNIDTIRVVERQREIRIV